MESKKINQLATELAPDLSDLTIIGDPTTGISKKITLSQMASLFTGTVEEYATLAAFPLVGVADTIYIALDTNIIYRYDTSLSAYVILSPNIINSLVFSDANGFDGTITLVGSVATLSITTALTLGSVPFIGASGALTQDNANFFWDDTNNRLGIATALPTTPLDVFGSGIIGRLNATSTNNSFLGFASNGTNKWSVGNVQSDHRFRIFSEANSAELVSVLQTGEFGIGIANPTTKFHIDGGASALIANLDANVSVAKSISFRSDNSNRINLEVSGTESGSNAGADFFLRTFTDAGSLLETPFTIVRSTGVTTIKSLTLTNVLSVANGGTGATSFTSGSILFSNGSLIAQDNANFFWDDTNNRLGIGTISPSVKLQVEDSSSTSLNILYLVNSSTAAVTTKQNNLSFRMTDTTGARKNAFQLTAYSDSAGGNIENGGLIFKGRKADVDTEYMRINSAGNVGIGTTNPQAALHITGAISSAPAADGVLLGVQSDFAVIHLNGSASTGSLIDFSTNGTDRKGRIEYNNVTNDMIFSTNASQKLTITSAGNVGIGVTPYSDVRFMTRGASATSADYSFRAENSSGTNIIFGRNDGLINTGTQSASPYNNSIAPGLIIYANSSGELGYVASIRESKINIKPIDDFNIINKLNPVSFNYRKKDENNQYTDEFDENIFYGLIADEVEKIDSNLVFYDKKEDGTKELKGVYYEKLAPLLIKSIQEQQAQIEELKALIAAK